jgi:hypothetical protein
VNRGTGLTDHGDYRMDGSPRRTGPEARGIPILPGPGITTISACTAA